MNGYKLIADGYRKMVENGRMEKEQADKEIRILDFLATCDSDDKCRLVDSSAFNDIIKAYCKKALQNAEVEQETEDRVMNELCWLFDTVQAGEICK